MYLKFVNRLGHVPHESFMLECNSFRRKTVKWIKTEIDSQYSPQYFPFEEPKEEDVVMIVSVTGAPGYEHIAGSNVILFVMNDQGETIDKTQV